MGAHGHGLRGKGKAKPKSLEDGLLPYPQPKTITGIRPVLMFFGRYDGVVDLTGHLPLKQFDVHADGLLSADRDQGLRTSMGEIERRTFGHLRASPRVSAKNDFRRMTPQHTSQDQAERSMSGDKAAPQDFTSIGRAASPFRLIKPIRQSVMRQTRAI